MESNRGIGRGRFFESGISEKPKCNIGSTDGASSTSTCADGERPIGRGRLLQHLTILKKASSTSGYSSGVSSPSSSGGYGRAKFLSNLAAHSSIASLSDRTGSVQINDSSSETSSNETSETTCTALSQEVVRIHGEYGTPLKALTNFIRLRCKPNAGVFEYEVCYEPVVHSMPKRRSILNEHKNIIGNVKTFDGTTLYLPNQLSEPKYRCVSKNLSDGEDVVVTITFRRKRRMGESIQHYNVLFNQIMRTLKYVQINRRLFNPNDPKIIPQHKLEIWPGFVTAVDEYEDGLMLQLDVSHKMLFNVTVRETMTNIHNTCQRTGANFQDLVKQTLLGQVVLTRYNNKNYRIDDVDFDANPEQTFTDRNGEQISYVQYYRSQYGIEIRDKRQPLLINRKERIVAGESEPETLTFCIIPELCYLTGLTDEMRNDEKIMRDVATYTRVTPNQRIAAMKKFCQNVHENPEARAILENWGLSLDENPIELMARNLGEEKIIFGNNKVVSAGPTGNFDRHVGSSMMFDVVNITSWILIHTRADSKYAHSFIDCMERNAGPMGMTIVKPTVCVLGDDKTTTYVSTLRQKLTANTQIVVVICPTSRDDRYAAIKKVCCAETPIASQVINSRTLAKKDQRAIVQKIALQMNCKMGGSLWSIRIPFDNVMICGIDTYHDPSNKNGSVAAFVASLNNTYTKYYSRAKIQSRKEEIHHGLSVSLQKSLMSYKKINGVLPDRIIIYRDGVSDGQLNVCKDFEVPQMKSACHRIDSSYNPTVTFLVVQKRINARIFQVIGKKDFANPSAGTVLDNTITRRFLYDFFLISQKVSQGTVTPTHLIVLHDEADFKADVLQRLSYKLCFLYYNWAGTIRTPAVCQYAHKLAYLVGQSVKRETAEKLAETLFYL